MRRIVLTGSLWETLLSVAGTAVAGYVLYRNVWPLPPAPYRWFPLAVLVWLTATVLLTATVPGLSSRLRTGQVGAGPSEEAQ